jgi:hypothetical protein
VGAQLTPARSVSMSQRTASASIRKGGRARHASKDGRSVTLRPSLWKRARRAVLDGLNLHPRCIGLKSNRFDTGTLVHLRLPGNAVHWKRILLGFNARVSLLVVLADLSRQCLLVGCGGNYVRRHVCVRIASSREKNGFNCVWFAHQAETAWGAQADLGPRGLDSAHFRSAPRTCWSAVGWGCGKSPIGL